jgi:hypothetical protein
MLRDRIFDDNVVFDASKHGYLPDKYGNVLTEPGQMMRIAPLAAKAEAAAVTLLSAPPPAPP